jgi:hypothetical protein
MHAQQPCMQATRYSSLRGQRRMPTGATISKPGCACRWSDAQKGAAAGDRDAVSRKPMHGVLCQFSVMAEFPELPPRTAVTVYQKGVILSDVANTTTSGQRCLSS